MLPSSFEGIAGLQDASAQPSGGSTRGRSLAPCLTTRTDAVSELLRERPSGGDCRASRTFAREAYVTSHDEINWAFPSGIEIRLSASRGFRLDDASIARAFRARLPERVADLLDIAMEVYAADRLSTGRTSETQSGGDGAESLRRSSG